MDITQEHESKIREIIGGMKCKKDFECYRSGFENLCKVKIGVDAMLIDCKEENANNCDFSLSFGFGYICTCPLRKYIAKNFNI